MTTTLRPTPATTSSDRATAPAGRSSWLEPAGAALLFTVLAFAVYGWYAFEGGFVADDWVNADHYNFHPEPGFWGAVDNYQTPSRPVAAVYVSLTHAVLGTHFHYHLVLAVLLAAFLSTAFFAFLRTLGVGLTLALAAAALLLVFPSSDSTRFWATGSQINLFIGLYLVSAVIAIVGRRRFGPAPTLPAVMTQVLASALAVTAVAGYEIVAPAVLLSVFLYRWVGKGGEIWRWLLDAIPTVLVLVFFTQKFGGGAAHGMQLLTNVRLVADGAISILGYTMVPTREMSRWLVFSGVAAVILVTLLVRRFAPATPRRDRSLARPVAAGGWGDRHRLPDDRSRGGSLPALRARSPESDQLLRRARIVRPGGIPAGSGRVDLRRRRARSLRESSSAASHRSHRRSGAWHARGLHRPNHPGWTAVGEVSRDPGPDLGRGARTGAFAA